jgi:flagellar hook-length control protein FliK
MIVPLIGPPGPIPPAGAAAPAPPSAAQTLPPFMLQMPAVLPEPVTMPTAGPATVDADPPADEDAEAMPLIGWLFDSIALAGDAPAGPSPAAAARGPRPDAQQRGPRLPAPGVNDAPAPAPPAGRSEPSLLPTPPTAAGITAPESFAETIQPTALLPSGPAMSPPPAAVAAAPAAGAAPPPPPVVVHTDGADFGADLGERISWQLQQGIGEATIELHPAELGALTVRIETQAQQAQVHILAAEPAARALLSQCLPQLRELLGASGLTLTRGQVESAERRCAQSGAGGDGLPGQRTRRRVASVTLVDAWV